VATNVSNSMMRSLSRGSVSTRTLPSGSAPTGVFTEDDGPADGQMAALAASSSDDVFGELFEGGPCAAPLAGAQDQEPPAARWDSSPKVFGDHSDSDFDRPAPEVISTKPPVAVVSNPAGSRAVRFGTVSGPAPAAERVYNEPPASPAAPVRSWSRFVSPDDKAEALNVRKSLAAAKVLTPLVAAVSFSPGSSGASDSKAKALREMLVGMHKCAVATAESVSDRLGQDVPSWMVTQLMQSMATAIARRWERGAGADIASMSVNMAAIFGDANEDISRVLIGASEDAYVEVDHPDITRFRISVSAANAAWVLHDWVTHERLSVDDKGDMPSRFFTYGRQPSEIVNMMLVRCVDECRGLVAQVESADLRTAHMQSAINRMANLIGAEYVTRTRVTMNWIADPSISDAEYQSRLAIASADMQEKVLPQVFEYARVNFLRIEQGAFRAIEDLYEKTKQDGLVPRVDSRPAAA